MKIECACGSEDVDVITIYPEITYKGFVQVVEETYCGCCHCGLEFMTTEQLSNNLKLIREAKAEIDRYILENPDDVL
jgi:hypothetical protein